MPANLTPQYYKAQERYRAATEPREQLDALQEMLRIIPKHKGTEHLQADLKKKIKEARAEFKSSKRKKRGPSYSVDSGEYPQVVVVGPPNAGKSAITSALSGAELVVAPYPYTTHEPHPAMMPFENTRVQLVDMPPISADHMEPWISSIVRAADAALLVIDLADGDLLDACEGVLRQLAGHKVFLGDLPEDQQEVIGALGKRTLVAANKCDSEDAAVAMELFCEVHGERHEVLPVSATNGDRMEELRKRIWEMLDLVRAVPKPPGKPPDYEDPILLPRGSTVTEMAHAIHRELAEKLKRARIWRSSDHPEGTWVSREHVVVDGEVFELDL
jgi:ribosome-interacting GTPase 1